MIPPALRTRWRALVPPLTLLAVDLWLRRAAHGSASPRRWSRQDVAVYALGALFSIGSWQLGAELLSRRPRGDRARAGVLAIASLAAASLFLASFAYRLELDQSASWQALKWSIAELRSVWMIARWIVGPWHVLALVGMGALFVVALRGRLAPLRATRGRLAIALGAYGVLGALVLGAPGFQDPLPVDANAAAAFAQYGLASLTKVRHLVAPVRPTIPPQPARRRPNVLVLVHEALRADAVFGGLDYATLPARESAPFGVTIPARRAEGYHAFPFARTNSTATESSVPAILSGVDPGGPTDAYGRATSLWQLGKACGAATFLFSAQSYSFSHFDEYFLDANVDRYRTGEELSAELVNDRGVDDGVAVDSAIVELASLAARGAFFVGVVHFNATHPPGFPGPGVALRHAARDDVEQYVAAARYVDRLEERLINALDRLGLAETTIVIATSDHGEIIGPHHPTDRVGNYYEECVRVPLWIRLPPALERGHPDWARALDAWAGRGVQNLDVLPTVVDALALEGAPALAGQSLLRAPSGDDEVRGQSTCAYRQWALDGVYLVHDRVKVIVSSDVAHVQIFDLATDPHEARDLFADEAWRARATPWLLRALAEGQERRAACLRAGAACPR